MNFQLYHCLCLLDDHSSSSDSSVIIIGTMGGVILLLIITIVMCIVILCVRCNKKGASPVDNKVFNNTTSCKRNTNVTIENNPSYVTGFDKSRLGRTHQARSFSTTNRQVHPWANN